MTRTFNLTTESWLGCSDLQHKSQFLSLHDVLQRAHELSAISDNNPLTVAALHRLLLAIIHRAIKGPKNFNEWKHLWQQGSFANTVVLSYLDEQAHHFDLFSKTDPFYQTANFKLDTDAASHKLFHELTAGSNKTLFDHSIDDIPLALTPAQAARALITTQMYALGGGQGSTSNLGKHPYLEHAPLLAGAVVLIRGKTLFETLMLNLLFYDQKKKPIVSSEKDAPIWESAPSEPHGETPLHGYLNYLTWRSRHIRLVQEEEKGQTVVRKLYLAQANMLYKAFHVKEHDPMFCYRLDKDGNKKSLKLSRDKALWRDSLALFEFSEKYDGRADAFKQARELQRLGHLPQGRLRSMIIGLANDRANLFAWRIEELNVPQAILDNDALVQNLKEALRWAEEICNGKSIEVAGSKKKDWFRGLRGCTRRLAELLLTNGGRTADKDDVTRLTITLGTEARYWADLEPHFYDLLGNLGDSEAQNQWYKTVVDTAKNSLEQAAQHYAADSARGFQAQVKALACFSRAYTLLKEELGDD